jgi:class 3 adenylate cyclase
LDHMMEHEVPTLTAILQLVQDAELRPSSIFFYPVFDAFSSGHAHTSKVEGSISIVFSWDNLLDKILPDYIKGMVCVLRSSKGQQYSYSISGHAVTLLGEGDMHDADYNKYGHRIKANVVNKGVTVDDDDAEDDYHGRDHRSRLITYELHMYPSPEFKSQYVTNRPAIYAAAVVLIFLFTAGLFLLYDYLVEGRQQRTARLARQRGNIVDSMFPAAFRERLYNSHNTNNNGNGSVKDAATNSVARRRSNAGSNVSSSINTAPESGVSGDASARATAVTGVPVGEKKLSLPRKMSVRTMGGGKIALRNKIDMFMKGNRMSDNGGGAGSDENNPMAPLVGGVGDEPIADLYHNTSIMFSDIVGFTKWSSERSPNEVFHLLEQIFWEFDDIAARHNVFKLGTIGDCYIAVTGIPDPIEDHAIVLTQFAFEARDKVREVCSRLQGEGLDTARLDMRFGIHSGPTTAGILRGTKSRFELFGDTINTAGRMESTGLSGKIQVSEETAELIRRDGESRWLFKRDTTITAKGKGELQTYWVEPQRASCKISKFFLEDNSNLANSSGSDQDFYQGVSSEYNTSNLHLHESTQSYNGLRLSSWGEDEKAEVEDDPWDEEEKVGEMEDKIDLEQGNDFVQAADGTPSNVGSADEPNQSGIKYSCQQEEEVEEKEEKIDLERGYAAVEAVDGLSSSADELNQNGVGYSCQQEEEVEEKIDLERDFAAVEAVDGVSTDEPHPKGPGYVSQQLNDMKISKEINQSHEAMDGTSSNGIRHLSQRDEDQEQTEEKFDLEEGPVL